jgi:hypothetical protein
MNHPQHSQLISLVEENKVAASLEVLLEWCKEAAPGQEAAVRLLRSSLNELKQDELLFGRTSSIRERRTALKLQILRLADQLSSIAPQNNNIDQGELKKLLREEGTEKLIAALFEKISERHAQYDTLILIEQSWKDYLEDARNGTDTAEHLTVRANKVNRQLLSLIGQL